LSCTSLKEFGGDEDLSKTFLALACTFLVLVLITYLLMSSAMGGYVNQLEEREALVNMDRVVSAIDYEVSTTAVSVRTGHIGTI
jgi:sensor domain CHASE-containing protein